MDNWIDTKLFDNFEELMDQRDAAIAKEAAEKAAAEQRRKEEEAQKTATEKKVSVNIVVEPSRKSCWL